MLLAVAVGLSWQTGRAHSDETSFPIVRSPLAEARAVFEKRRLRNALQAERLLTGAWPNELAGIERALPLGGDALARAAARPYYYARHQDGVVLLAPER